MGTTRGVLLAMGSGLVTVSALVCCGGSSDTSNGGTSTSSSGGGDTDAAMSPDTGMSPPPSGDASDASTTDEDGGLTLAQRTTAVNATATADPLCTKLGDFYWEIGDATGTLGSGAVGTTYTATTNIAIASASKFVFGAYMIEATMGALTAAEKQELRMLSGYYGLDPTACALVQTVADCVNAGSPGPNYKYSAADVGSFYYGGAHDEYFANTAVASGGLGLGADTTADLNALIMPMLKSPGFAYKFPEFAGGIASTPSQFAKFLQSIVANQLLIHDYLGVDPVCTLPGASCPAAIASPIPVAWHYSYNHWVEDDATSDGTFSSPGAFGFYPWISADKTLYGVLARKDEAGGNGDGDGAGPGYDSAACGLKLRAAWSSGQTK